MFIIQPFEQPTRIRSSLGFMSLATRWGEYLFPGITVLTRDVRDLKAMHDTALAMKVTRDAPSKLKRFQSPDCDHRIASHLRAFLHKQGIDEPAAELQQKMSYWQRYGNTFNYFDLLSLRSRRSPEALRALIFTSRPTLFSNQRREDATSRKRRVKHFNWYWHFRNELLPLDSEQTAEKVLKGPDNRWRLWWLEGGSAPVAAPPAIQLVRELELTLVVFQIIFESAAMLANANDQFLPRIHSAPAGTIPLIQAYLKARSGVDNRDNLRNLLAIALRYHEKHIASHMTTWVKRAKTEIGTEPEPLVTFHGNRDIGEFANVDAKPLIEKLADLHVAYCHQQGKPHAIIVQNFFPRPDLGTQLPELTPTFSRSRWGLHGYRFEAAVALATSRKYEPSGDQI